jgi:hypothetical protein
MNSTGIWFAILAAIFAGTGIYIRRHGKPKVRKPLMIGLWVAAGIAAAVGVVAVLNGR